MVLCSRSISLDGLQEVFGWRFVYQILLWEMGLQCSMCCAKYTAVLAHTQPHIRSHALHIQALRLWHHSALSAKCTGTCLLSHTGSLVYEYIGHTIYLSMHDTAGNQWVTISRKQKGNNDMVKMFLFYITWTSIRHMFWYLWDHSMVACACVHASACVMDVSHFLCEQFLQ